MTSTGNSPQPAHLHDHVGWNDPALAAQHGATGALFALGRSYWVKPGTRVMAAYQEVPSVFLVRSGEIHLELRRQRAEPVVAAIVRKGGTFGDSALLSGNPVVCDAVAQRDSELVEIPRREFVALLNRDPRLMMNWLRAAACRQEQMQWRLLMLVTKDLVQQVACILILAREVRVDGRAVVTLSHQDIAGLLGARRPSVSRVIQKLRSDALVDTGYRCLEILDVEALADLAGDLGTPPCAARWPLPYIG